MTTLAHVEFMSEFMSEFNMKIEFAHVLSTSD
ncbi:hypothetical protein MTCD1_02718 [Colwellia marinimaniae]|uniref:Uncharacterized protein n=1 Tax=Colwellia marinimaniae TaxID=1513592 RepID=A0ABQ0MXI3_9GAMM|nr:hypothetical protein MTCD1_02718 [Colwellia marinimaniae]